MNIGIFGGTFNPPHKGHINVAKVVVQTLLLDKLLIVPAKVPPHKPAEDLVGERQRVEMCRQAFQEISIAEISEIEINSENKSYSVLTLRKLKKLYPNDKLWFVMGSDMLISFKSWYLWEEILTLCSLVCISRSNEDTKLLQNYADELAELGECVVIPTEPFEISSTEIRNKIKNNEDITCYLSENVVKYINTEKLYSEV